MHPPRRLALPAPEPPLWARTDRAKSTCAKPGEWFGPILGNLVNLVVLLQIIHTDL